MGFVFDREKYWLIFKNKTKPFFDTLLIILLAGLSVIGCISTEDNIFLYFLIFYLAVYCFCKEIYFKIMVERRQKVFQIKMQKIVECKECFADIFMPLDEFILTKKQSFVNRMRYKKDWIVTYYNQEKNVIGILFNKKRYFFVLRETKHKDSLDYIISQLELKAEHIKTIDELNEFKIKVIADSKVADELGYVFMPYSSKDEKLKMPIITGEFFFYVTMMLGFILGCIIMKLVLSWITLSLILRIILVAFGAISLFLFLGSVLMIVVFCFDTLKNAKSLAEKQVDLNEKIVELNKKIVETEIKIKDKKRELDEIKRRTKTLDEELDKTKKQK